MDDAARWQKFLELLKRDVVAAQGMVWNSGGSKSKFRTAVDRATVD